MIRPLSIVWNFDPVFFSIGSLDIRYYGLMWALAILIGAKFFDNFCKREGLPPKVSESIFIYGTLATIIGARLGHCLFYDPMEYLSKPWTIITGFRDGGMASHGAAIGLLIGLWLFSRKNKLPYIWSLDRIMIGFNGVKRAKPSNRSENPLLQDVNKGWLQKIREDAPDHVMGSTTTGGETTPGAVKVGKGGEYANLDAVVMDAVNELIDVVYQDDDDLVVICGRELLSDKYFPLVNKEQENSEKLAADMIISQKRMGGLQAVRAPFFPPNALLITRLDNLSIYWQEDTRRRSVIDNPKRDRIENFESVNEAYVVEDYRCAALVENIQIGDFSAAAAETGA